MYSGTTFRNKSGHLVGVHQRIDRLARRNLAQISPHANRFPRIKEILHFEGNNGPDGIKRKSPSVDEPWHYIHPADPSDRALVGLIVDHEKNLKQALQSSEHERASFEAAWLAHAITDGLTPAHHYPLSDKIEELWGHPKEQRLTVLQKNVIKGLTLRDSVGKNWEYWGAKGVFATHILFELGVASSMTTHRFASSLPTESDIAHMQSIGIAEYFLEAAHAIHKLNMYEEFWHQGWTTKLARQTREQLMPIIIRTVTLAWYDALEESQA